MADKGYDLELAEYKGELKRFMEKSQDSFEKQLSFISAGAFGVTMAFIDKIVGNLKETTCTRLLIIGWLFLGLTFIVNLFSHVFAVKVYYRTIKEMDDKKYSQALLASRIKKINYLNTISIISLLLGIAIIVIFISYNILPNDK